MTDAGKSILVLSNGGSVTASSAQECAEAGDGTATTSVKNK